MKANQIPRVVSKTDFSLPISNLRVQKLRQLYHIQREGLYLKRIW